MKVREWLEAWAMREGGFVAPNAELSLWSALERGGILDATLIQDDVCPTCGGDGEVATGQPVMLVGGVDVSVEPCPDCHGKRNAVVIEQKKWEAFKACATELFYPAEIETGAMEAKLAQLATVLLGQPPLIAKAVGELSVEHVGDGQPIAMLIGDSGETLGTARTGDRIAIVEDSDD